MDGNPQRTAGRSSAAVSLADITREHQARQDGDAAARRALNALSVTSELVSALIVHPGTDKEHGALVQSVREMISSAHGTVQQLEQSLGLSVFPWARHRLMRLMAQAVADRWQATARQGKASADISDLVPMWMEVARHDLPAIVYEDPAPEPAAALRIAMLDAMHPVMTEIALFDFFHDPQEAAAHARDTILVTARRALAMVTTDPMSDRSRSLMMQALLRTAGKNYASAWRRAAEDTVERMQTMEPAQQAALIQQHPGGLPLDAIDESFRNSFLNLAEMVQYLATPKAPAMETVERPSEYERDDDGMTAPLANASGAATGTATAG